MTIQSTFDQVTDKALIVAKPWARKLVGDAGQIDKPTKTKEMRTRATKERGWKALIESKSGTIIGMVKISDSTGPHSAAALKKMTGDHHVTDQTIDDPNYKWWHAWHISEAFALQNPVPYTRKSGQVIWVSLLEDDCEKLTLACIETLNAMENASKKPQDIKRVQKIKSSLGL